MKQQRRKYYINESLRNTTASNTKFAIAIVGTMKVIAEETGNVENRTYAEVARATRNPTRSLSKAKNTDNKHKQNIHEKLCLMSPTNRFRRQWNNLSKKTSNAKTTKNYTQQQKINELQEEINKPKHQ